MYILCFSVCQERREWMDGFGWCWMTFHFWFSCFILFNDASIKKIVM